uniref:Uncharacterized protein n=1 Tax=Ditylenchus dipsaci TaxID=166011 RepID=A0A915CSQ0_9BILA
MPPAAIFSAFREFGQRRTSLIPVDAHFSELTLSLSGERDDGDYLSIELIDPQNRTVEKSSYQHEAWTLDCHHNISSKHTLRVFGHGVIDFKYGFASRPVQTVDLAHPRPIAGQNTYLLVNMTGLNPPGLVVQISLVDYHGNELFRNETRIHKHNSYLYFVGPFMPPKGFSLFASMERMNRTMSSSASLLLPFPQ